AAAVIVASEEAAARGRPVRVLASVAASEEVYDRAAAGQASLARAAAGQASSAARVPSGPVAEAALTASTAQRAFAEAGITPQHVDVLELHDAFSVEEPLYVEAMGLADPGAAPALLADGAFDPGGRVAVNPSGGLLGMGH